MKNQFLTLVMILMLSLTFSQCKQYNPNPTNTSKELLNPANHPFLLIGHKSQMASAVESPPIEELRNNLGLLTASAGLFEIPTKEVTFEKFAGLRMPNFSRLMGNRSLSRRNLYTALPTFRASAFDLV